MAMLAPTAGRTSNPFAVEVADTDWKRISDLPFPLEKRQIRIWFGASPVVTYSPATSDTRPRTVSGNAPTPLPNVPHTENVSVFWRDASGDLWSAYAGTFTYLAVP